MHQNIGGLDRNLRIALGVGVMGIGIVLGSWILGALGVLPLASAYKKWDPLYHLLGICSSKTCKKHHPKSKKR